MVRAFHYVLLTRHHVPLTTYHSLLTTYLPAGARRAARLPALQRAHHWVGGGGASGRRPTYVEAAAAAYGYGAAAWLDRPLRESGRHEWHSRGARVCGEDGGVEDGASEGGGGEGGASTRARAGPWRARAGWAREPYFYLLRPSLLLTQNPLRDPGDLQKRAVGHDLRITYFSDDTCG